MAKLYYYYYYIYTKILPDDEPHATTVFILSFTESLYANAVITLTLAYLFCFHYGKWIAIGIFGVNLLINYLTYSKTKKGKKIVSEKREKKFLDLVATILFTLIAISIPIWIPIIEENILKNCR